MARTVITKTTAPGNYAVAGVTLAFTAADSTNNNSFAFTGHEVLVVRNKHASAAKTFTVNSAPNGRGRTKDVTAQSLVAGAYAVLGPFRQKEGWAQSDGSIYLTGEDNNIEFAVVVLPT